jgi:hypothetical protein
MNDGVWNDLAGHVRQTLGALAASASRRQQMQEELLAHLLDIYDEELCRLQDERAAAERAKLRFGRPADLCRELTTAIPWGERLIQGIWGKESIMWRWLWIVGILAMFVGMGFVLPAVAQLRSPNPIMPNDRFGIAVLLPFGVVVTLGGLGLVGYSLLRVFRARRCCS